MEETAIDCILRPPLVRPARSGQPTITTGYKFWAALNNPSARFMLSLVALRHDRFPERRFVDREAQARPVGNSDRSVLELPGVIEQFVEVGAWTGVLMRPV